MDFWIWAAEEVPWWGIALPLSILLLIALVIWRQGPWRERMRQEQVRRHGQAGTATVLQVTDTGERSPLHMYVLRLRLRVQPDAGQPFDTVLNAPVSPLRFADFAEGSQVRVRVASTTREVALDQRTE